VVAEVTAGGGYDFSGLGFGGGCATAGGGQPQTQASAPVISPQQQSRQQVDALYEKGRGYYNQAEDMAAVNAFSEAFQLDPSDQEVRSALGSSLFNCGMDAGERADRLSQLVYHERAVKLVPDDLAFKYRHKEALKHAPERTCSTCTKALESDVVHGLRMSRLIFQYVHQATVNYKNCTRRLNCADNDGSHFYYLARESCYQTFQNSERGFRSCLQQALEDRGHHYYWPNL